MVDVAVVNLINLARLMMYVMIGNNQIYCPRHLLLVLGANLLSYLMLQIRLQKAQATHVFSFHVPLLHTRSYHLLIIKYSSSLKIEFR